MIRVNYQIDEGYSYITEDLKTKYTIKEVAKHIQSTLENSKWLLLETAEGYISIRTEDVVNVSYEEVENE